MNGTDYRAKVRLSTKDNETLADAGDTCERVPASSLGWLAEQHLIERIASAGITALADDEDA